MITNVDDLVGNPSAQPQGVFIDAEKVQGVPVDNNNIGNGKALVYDSTSQKLVYGEVLTDVVVESVNGKIGEVVISKSDIGLSAVENLAPLDMPISNDTQTALNDKVDKEVGQGLSENNLTNSLKSSYDSAVENSHTHTNKLILDNIINTGLGDKYLSDDGTYKTVAVTSEVESVNGKTGIVEITKADIGLDYVINTGDGTKYLSDNGTYKTVEGSGAETFLQLTDTPTSYTGEVGKFVRVKIDGTGLEFANVGGGGEGVDNFLELTDTPNTYIGQANKVLSVNSTESSIEFIRLGIPSRTSDLTNDSSFVTDNDYVHTDNNYTTTEKTKLSGIEENANNYVLPSNVVIDENYIHTDTNYTQEEKTKLLGIMDGAEVNIQADWDTTDVNDDSFIKNKPTIADSFLELDDTPTSYSGNADKMVAVNSTGTGLTFVDGGSGGGGFTPIQMYKAINTLGDIGRTDGQMSWLANPDVNQGGIYITKLSPTLYDVSFYFRYNNVSSTNLIAGQLYTLDFTIDTGLGSTFSSYLQRKLPTEEKFQYQHGVCTCSVPIVGGYFYIEDGKIKINYFIRNNQTTARTLTLLGFSGTNWYSGRMTIDIGTGDLLPLAL